MRDEITTWRGESIVAHGGLLYNLRALAALLGDGDAILPFAFAGPGDRRAVVEGQDWPPLVDWTGLGACAEGSDENVLSYRSPSARDERMTLRTPPLRLADLGPAIDCDAILINFINGRELSLGTLAELRAATRAHIHLDVHNLGKGPDENGRLVARGLPGWRDWLGLVDTVQANEWEVENLLGRKPVADAECRAAALELLGPGNLKAAAVTVGGAGSFVAHRMGPGAGVRTLHAPALGLDDVRDTTGCGDSYSSGFVRSLLRSGNPARAALVASALSGLNARPGGLANVRGADDVEETVRRRFPELARRVADGWTGDPA